MQCSSCKHRIPEGARFCVNCGTPAANAIPEAAATAMPQAARQPQAPANPAPISAVPVMPEAPAQPEPTATKQGPQPSAIPVMPSQMPVSAIPVPASAVPMQDAPGQQTPTAHGDAPGPKLSTASDRQENGEEVAPQDTQIPTVLPAPVRKSSKKKFAIIGGGVTVLAAASVAVALVVANGGDVAKAVKAAVPGGSSVTISEIKDPGVRAAADGLDSDSDGKLSADEADAVKHLDVSGASDLSELGKIFPGITSLGVTDSSVASYDLAGLDKLQSIVVADQSINELDVSGAKQLESVQGDIATVNGLDAIGLEQTEVLDSVELTNSETGTSWTIYAEWDPSGLVPSAIVTDGQSSSRTELTYDDDRRLVKSEDDNSSNEYTYDDDGNVTVIKRELSFGGKYGSVDWTYEYNAQGQLVKTQNGEGVAAGKDINEGDFPTSTYEYDAAGHLTKIRKEWKTHDGEQAFSESTYTWEGDCPVGEVERDNLDELTDLDYTPSINVGTRTCDAANQTLSYYKESRNADGSERTNGGLIHNSVKVNRDDAGRAVQLVNSYDNDIMATIEYDSAGNIASATMDKWTYTPTWRTVYAKKGAIRQALGLQPDLNTIFYQPVAVVDMTVVDADPEPDALQYERLDTMIG